MASVPDIKSVSYDVCGVVRMASAGYKAKVALTHGPENVKPQVKQTDDSGKFCFEKLGDKNLKEEHPRRLEKMGALECTNIVRKHQAWRLVTCIWLHAGVINLAANMLSLVFIGIRLEQQFGFDGASSLD